MYQEESRESKLIIYRYYEARTLILLSGVCIVGTLLFLGLPLLYHTVVEHGIGSLPGWLSRLSLVGGLVLFGESIVVMLLDYQGAISLRGAVKPWFVRRRRVVNRFPWLLLCYALTPWLVLPFYIIRASLDERYLRAWRYKKEIVFLEAQRGIVPAFEGICRVCKRPLVVGASFCQYCRAPVVLLPKVCPRCLFVASPDALWCPRCQASLSSLSTVVDVARRRH
jgi:hypothetical protein